MGQRLRIVQEGEPWIVHEVEETKSACIEVLTAGFRYKNFRVVKYELFKEFGKTHLKERTLPGRSTTHEDNHVRRWSKIQDGIYRLQWGEMSDDEEWKPVPMFFGSNWRVQDAKFKGLKVPQHYILKELLALEQRQTFSLVEAHSDEEE